MNKTSISETFDDEAPCTQADIDAGRLELRQRASDGRLVPPKMLETLHAKREAIAAAGKRFGARRIRVFGSLARGEETPSSDIDFLVDFPSGYDLFTQRLPLAERLAEITGHRVDLIPERDSLTETRRHGGERGWAQTVFNLLLLCVSVSP